MTIPVIPDLHSRSPSRASGHDQLAAAAVARPALSRAGQVAVVTGAALLLTGPASSYLTGVILPVDGGWTAH